jgi:hypothetical protein
MSNLKLLGCLLSFLFLFACASHPLTSAGEKVKVTTHGETIQACHFIKQLTELYPNFDNSSHDALRNSLRNKTAELGGNLLLEQEETKTARGMQLIADAYFCPD